MRHQFSLISVSVMALALSACGGPPAATADDPELGMAPDSEIVAPAADGVGDGAVDDAPAAPDEADAALATPVTETPETPAPIPVATPTARASAAPRAAPTPIQIAAMTPPAGFATCGMCHSVEPGQSGVGPTLAGVVGRKAGSVAGANYSAAMRGVNVTWSAANLERYLVDPEAIVPGGSMPAPGLNAAQARAVVEYLRTL